MKRQLLFALVAATLLAVSCADMKTPPPTPAPKGDDRFLVDPRVGVAGPVDPALDGRFDAAWRYILAGDIVEARKRIADIRARYPEYLPASIAEAALDMKQGQLDAARTIVKRIQDREPDYTAARVYDAEIAMAQHRTREAYEIYRALSLKADAPPTVAERLTTLQNRLFEELFTAAQSAPDEESIGILREALTINAGATNARILLANKLIARKSWDEARQVLEPLVTSADFDKAEVQESLAEIEVGRGQYEQAIARYDRLARRNADVRYRHRLDELKQEWTAANMPPQYQQAIDSESINRSDLAVLVYWKISSIRFDQNLGTPPIAIDIEGVAGRDEIIRAIAIGLYDVDPVTRRVSPLRPVNAGTFERLLAKLLWVRATTCAHSVPYERDETVRSQRILAACGITDPVAGAAPDSPVSGKAAAAALDEVAKVMGH